MRYICGVKEIITPITNKNITIMATNKNYNVIRMTKRAGFTTENLYKGRMRDCKNYLKGTGLAYEEHGYKLVKTTFQIIVYEGNTPEVWYMITED